jgi:hypothetical protein
LEPWALHWKDYYKILQVHVSAEPEVIKAAYDKLARKYHPDVNQNPTASERMKDINEAFEVLSVTLQSIDSTNPETPVYNYIFRVVNNESFDMRLYWKMDSSITGKPDSGYVTVLSNSYRDVTRSYDYFTDGMETVTYTIYYNGTLLDTCSSTGQ